ALNTGLDGGCGTVHVNRAGDLPARLEALGEAAGLGRAAVHSQAAAALSLVVHLRRGPVGRHVAELGVVRRRGELIEVAAGWRADGGTCPARDELAALLAHRVPG
ncbi:MAG: putative conjugal transfer protein, partial [Modestobacter sp.]|nr:putative conjugal transfer protein [Modestobacter sp.]